MSDFVMSLPKTKRLKHITAAGEEVFEEDEQWRFLQYVALPEARVLPCVACRQRSRQGREQTQTTEHVVQDAGFGADADKAQQDPGEAPLQPQEAIQHLLAAKARLSSRHWRGLPGTMTGPAWLRPGRAADAACACPCSLPAPRLSGALPGAARAAWQEGLLGDHSPAFAQLKPAHASHVGTNDRSRACRLSRTIAGLAGCSAARLLTPARRLLKQPGGPCERQMPAGAELGSPPSVNTAVLQGEVDLLAELLANVEWQQFVGVLGIEPRKTLDGVAAQRALLLRSKAQQLQVSALCVLRRLRTPCRQWDAATSAAGAAPVHQLPRPCKPLRMAASASLPVSTPASAPPIGPSRLAHLLPSLACCAQEAAARLRNGAADLREQAANSAVFCGDLRELQVLASPSPVPVRVPGFVWDSPVWPATVQSLHLSQGLTCPLNAALHHCTCTDAGLMCCWLAAADPACVQGRGTGASQQRTRARRRPSMPICACQRHRARPLQDCSNLTLQPAQQPAPRLPGASSAALP